MFVNLEFVGQQIVSQNLRHVALWDAGRTHKLSYFNGEPDACARAVADAHNWIEGNYLVEAWSEERDKSGRPRVSTEKCTWLVRGERAAAGKSERPAPAPSGADGEMVQLMRMMMARMDAMEQRINGTDDADDDDEGDEVDDAEAVRAFAQEWKPVVERGVNLVEDMVRKFANVPAGGAAPAAGPAASQGMQGAAIPQGDRDYIMAINRAMMRLKNTDPAQFKSYADMLLKMYGDDAVKQQQQQQQQPSNDGAQ